MAQAIQPKRSPKAGHRYISTTEGYKQNENEGLKEEVSQSILWVNRLVTRLEPRWFRLRIIKNAYRWGEK